MKRRCSRRGLLEMAPQRTLVPHDEVVDALTPQGPDHAFDEGFCQGDRGAVRLPQRPSLARCVADRKCRSVAIPDEESRRGVPGPRLAELLRGPYRGWMRRHVDVDDAPAIVRQHHEHKQDPKRGRGYREEITRRELGGVVGEEGPPRLGRGRPAMAGEVFATVACAMWSPASAVRRGRAVRPSAGWPRASAGSVRARQQPGRVDRVVAATISSASSARTPTMPSHDGVGSDQLKGASPIPPQPRQEHPEPPIGVTQPRALRRLALQDGELMPESENLRLSSRRDRTTDWRAASNATSNAGMLWRTVSVQARNDNDHNRYRISGRDSSMPAERRRTTPRIERARLASPSRCATRSSRDG